MAGSIRGSCCNEGAGPTVPSLPRRAPPSPAVRERGCRWCDMSATALEPEVGAPEAAVSIRQLRWRRFRRHRAGMVSLAVLAVLVLFCLCAWPLSQMLGHRPGRGRSAVALRSAVGAALAGHRRCRAGRAGAADDRRPGVAAGRADGDGGGRADRADGGHLCRIFRRPHRRAADALHRRRDRAAAAAAADRAGRGRSDEARVLVGVRAFRGGRVLADRADHLDRGLDGDRAADAGGDAEPEGARFRARGPRQRRTAGST